MGLTYGVEKDELLIMALIDGPGAVDRLQKESQEMINRNVILARKMFPSKESWEELGFQFKDIDDDILYEATLPIGWSLKPSDNPMGTEIYDQNGFLRATMSYKSAPYDRRASMSLHRKYEICKNHEKCNNGYNLIIYFGNEMEKLFVCEKFFEGYEATSEQISKNIEITRSYRKLTQQFADRYYPGWEDVNSYWDSAQVIQENSKVGYGKIKNLGKKKKFRLF